MNNLKDMGEEKNFDRNDEVYSKVIRAGKRTYFFDVKSTRGNDLYLTVTESKKSTHQDGRTNFQKHKIFLYKEDFEKFQEGLTDALDKIIELKNNGEYVSDDEQDQEIEPYSSVSFDDLG